MLLYSDKLQNISGKLKINNSKFQNTGNFQNNVIKDAKQISSKGVIRMWIPPHKKFTLFMLTGLHHEVLVRLTFMLKLRRL